MTRYEPSVQVPPDETLRPRRGGRLWHVFAGFGVVFVGGSLLLWLVRKPIAEQALAAWCAERDLECDAKFTELGTSGITITALKVSSDGKVPAEATEVQAQIRWTGWFTPEVTGVTVNGLSLRGTLDAAGVNFGGLERLVPSGGGGGAAPPVDIRDARILLATPFGQANATMNVSGTLPRNGQITIRIDPGDLSNPLASASLNDARVDVKAVDGQFTAELGIEVDSATSGKYSLDGLEVLSRADFHLDGGHPAAFEWSIRAADVVAPNAGAKDLRTSGRLEFTTLPDMTLDGVMDALSLTLVEADAANLAWQGYSIDTSHLEVELDGSKGDVSGPLVLTTGPARGPQGVAEALSFAGELQRQKSGPTGFDGRISITQAALDPELRKRVGRAFRLPGVLEGHVGVLRASFDRALAKFDAETGITLRAGGEGLTASGAGSAVMQAASGLNFTISPGANGSWIDITPERVTAEGSVSLSGGGAPDANMDVRSLSFVPGTVAVDISSFRLPRWSVGGRSLDANLKDIKLESRPDNLLIAASGQLGFAGEVAGTRFEPTRLTGGVDAARDADGWRVQAAGARCLAIDTGGLTLGAISVEPARLDVCPANGRFMRQGPVPSGSANLGTVGLPFTTDSGAGKLLLKGTAVDWSAATSFAVTVRADTLSLPLQLGERTLTIDGASPRINIETGKGPAKIVARLGETDFGGTMIPANVSAKSFAFDGVSAASGVEATVSGKGVRVTDLQEDPLYEPITGEFSGTLNDNNRLQLAGPFSLEARGTPLADATLDIDILKLDGTAQLVSRPLVFTPGALQPDMISGRLTGLFTEARGGLSTTANFIIDGGDLQGTADVRVRGFGFQTTSLGRVTGVDGAVYFDDLMNLTTAPNQQFTLASVNPGIPLSNGRLVFDLRENGILHLETVTFPYSGGALAIAPFNWALEGGLTEQSVAVTAEGIQLAQLIETLKIPDMTATGTVSGSFPILLSDNRVQIKDARLRADPAGGRLSYTGGAVGAAAGQDANASLAFDALRDLRFDVLEVGINGDLAGDLRADLLLAGENINPLPMGKNLTLPSGQAFEFAIGFDLPIGKLIENNLGLISQQDVIDATLDLLNEDRLKKEKAGKAPE